MRITLENYLLTLKNVLERNTNLHKFTTGLKTDNSWSQDDKNGEEAAQVFEIIEIPSCVGLISDDSSEPVYFVKVEAK